MKKELSKETFDELLKQLSLTPALTKDKVAFKERVHTTNKSNILLKSKLVHYSTSNTKLNDIVNTISGKKTKDIIAFHTVESTPPNRTTPHVDPYSECTLNILLEDDFEGGEFYLNDKEYKNLYKKGQYALYNGSTDKHAVSKVTKGVRKTLIVWYKQSTDKSIL